MGGIAAATKLNDDARRQAGCRSCRATRRQQLPYPSIMLWGTRNGGRECETRGITDFCSGQGDALRGTDKHIVIFGGHTRLWGGGGGGMKTVDAGTPRAVGNACHRTDACVHYAEVIDEVDRAD